MAKKKRSHKGGGPRKRRVGTWLTARGTKTKLGEMTEAELVEFRRRLTGLYSIMIDEEMHGPNEEDRGEAKKGRTALEEWFPDIDAEIARRRAGIAPIPKNENSGLKKFNRVSKWLCCDTCGTRFMITRAFESELKRENMPKYCDQHRYRSPWNQKTTIKKSDE